MTERQLARFWQQITKTDSCWLWTGAKTQRGYGTTRCDDGYELTHRIAWEIQNKTPVPKGLCVMHSCDIRSCVNPSHLSVGTLAENCLDRHLKNRDTSGQNNPNTKLDPESVREIRRLFAMGESKRGLARRFGVAQYTVHLVLLGKTHKHVK